jgi:putative heme-binding domain-containing protein
MRSSGRRRAFFALMLLASAASGSAPLAARRSQRSQGHTYTTEDMQTGLRVYGNQCFQCHGANGDAVQGINLRRGQFRRPLSDEDLRRTISTGVPGTGMPPFAFQPAELDGLIAFMRAGFDLGEMAVKVGDASRGGPLFEGKGGCSTCHRVSGKGPRLAPDLSDIAGLRSPAQIYRSLTAPSSQMMPLNRPIVVVTRDGRTLRGRRLNEDTYTVQMIDEQERLVSLDKSDLANIEVIRVSPMPPATKALSGDELADLIAYLLTLRGQP